MASDNRSKLDASDPFAKRRLNMFDMVDDMAKGGIEPPQAPEKQVVVVPPDNALLPHDDGTMTYKRFVMHPTQLEIPQDVTADEWADFGGVLKQLDTTISWVVGEWAEFANKQWEYSYEAIAEHFGYEISTLMTYTSIVRKIPTSIRNQGLSFAHHRLVAGLPETHQKIWLEQAANMGWNVAQMRDAMRPTKQSDAHSASVRTLKKRVRTFSAELEELIGDLDETERQEVAQMLLKLAKKLGGKA